MGKSHRASRLGFTLVELLVVIAIIGVLVALLLPAVQAAREAARRSQCANNLHNIGTALLNYADAHDEVLPAATQYRPGKVPGDASKDNGPGGTWVMEILPFIEQQPLFARFNRTVPVNDNVNRDLLGISLPILVCPSDSEAPPGGVFPAGIKLDFGGLNRQDVPQMGLWYPVSAGPTHFDGCPFCSTPTPPNLNWCCQGNAFGSGAIGARNDPLGPPGTPAPTFAGLFGRYEKGIKLKDITDGLSNVVLAGEQINTHCRYTCAHCPNFPIAPTNIPLNTMLRHPDSGLSGGQWNIDSADPEIGGYAESCGYKSRHPGGAHMLMTDSSVKFFNEAIDFDLFVILGARSSDRPKQVP